MFWLVSEYGYGGSAAGAQTRYVFRRKGLITPCDPDMFIVGILRRMYT